MFSDNSFLSKEEEKPLNTCKECKTQPCIKTGKICDKVEKLLKKETIGRRNWLTYHTNDLLDDIAYKDKEGYVCNMKASEKGKRAKSNHSD